MQTVAKIHEDTLHPILEDEMIHINGSLDRQDIAYKDMLRYYLTDYDWYKRGRVTKVRKIWTGVWSPTRAAKNGVPNDMREIRGGDYKDDLVPKIRDRLRHTLDSLTKDDSVLQADGIISSHRESATNLVTSDGYNLPLLVRGKRQVLDLKGILYDYAHGHRDNIHGVRNMFNVSKCHPEYISTILNIIEKDRDSNVLIPVVE